MVRNARDEDQCIDNCSLKKCCMRFRADDNYLQILCYDYENDCSK